MTADWNAKSACNCCKQTAVEMRERAFSVPFYYRSVIPVDRIAERMKRPTALSVYAGDISATNPSCRSLFVRDAGWPIDQLMLNNAQRSFSSAFGHPMNFHLTPVAVERTMAVTDGSAAKTADFLKQASDANREPVNATARHGLIAVHWGYSIRR